METKRSWVQSMPSIMSYVFDTNRVGFGSDFAHWGMEVKVASLTGRLQKLGPYGHWTSGNQIQLVSFAILEAFDSWRGWSACTIRQYLSRLFVPWQTLRCQCRLCRGWTSSLPVALMSWFSLLIRWSIRGVWTGPASLGQQFVRPTLNSWWLSAHTKRSSKMRCCFYPTSLTEELHPFLYPFFFLSILVHGLGFVCVEDTSQQ